MMIDGVNAGAFAAKQLLKAARPGFGSLRKDEAFPELQLGPE